MPCLTHLQKQSNQGRAEPRRSTVFSIIILIALSLISWLVREAVYVQAGSLFTTGAWNAENADGSDLVYTVAFSRAEQPNGPLVVYRVSGADLKSVTPVFAMQRSSLMQTPVFFPSPDGRYLALLNPIQVGYATNLDGAALASYLPMDNHCRQWMPSHFGHCSLVLARYKGPDYWPNKSR